MKKKRELSEQYVEKNIFYTEKLKLLRQKEGWGCSLECHNFFFNITDLFTV